MKKLLGGILPRSHQAPTAAPEVPPPAPLPSSTAESLATQAPAAALDPGTLKGSQRPHDEKASAQVSRARTWGSLFMSSASATRKPTLPHPASGTQKTLALASPNADPQSVDVLMHEVVLKLKAVYVEPRDFCEAFSGRKVLCRLIFPLLVVGSCGAARHGICSIRTQPESEQFQTDLHELARVAALATKRLQQTSGSPASRLKSYFSSGAGVAICEQTAFPSLALGFVARMRVYMVQEALGCMVDGRTAGEDSTTKANGCGAGDAGSGASLIFRLQQPIRFLLECVVAIASSAPLLESFRCDLPCLIRLAAEEYPSEAIFISALSGQALASLSEQQVTAGLTSYLHDCDVVAKTVQLITSYAEATPTTRENAMRALELSIQRPIDFDSIGDWGTAGNEHVSVEAAVSDALGLTPKATTLQTALRSTAKTFCLPTYDVVAGLKALVTVLQKTTQCSPMLLNDFQSSGGYALLLRFLGSCVESKIPEMLHLIEVLLPLGSGPTTNPKHEDATRADRISTARNVDAFVVIRDSVLNLVAEQSRGDISVDTDPNITLDSRRENLALQLLTTVLHVYTSDYASFLLLESKTQTLALILTKLPTIMAYDAKVIILRIVEYVCCTAKSDDPLPLDLLSILCGLFIRSVETDFQSEINAALISAPPDTFPSTDNAEYPPTEPPRRLESNSTMLGTCIIKILKHAEVDAYGKLLSGFGLLECGIYVWLAQIANQLRAIPNTPATVKHRYMSSIEVHLRLWGTMVRLMLHGNSEERIKFRQLCVHNSLYAIGDALISSDLPMIVNMASSESCPGGGAVSILSVFTHLAEPRSGMEDEVDGLDQILQKGVGSDLSAILELVQRFRGSAGRQSMLLQILKQMLEAGGSSLSGPWISCQGFEVMIAILSSLEHLERDQNGHRYQVMDLALQILTVAVGLTGGSNAGDHGDSFKAAVGYTTIASCLVTSGVLFTDNRASVLNRVFDLIKGGPLSRDQVRNADAAQIVFLLLPRLPVGDGIYAIERILEALQAARTEECLSGKQQARRMVEAGVFSWLADPAISTLFAQGDHPLRPILAKLIVKINTAVDLSTCHLRELLRVVANGMPQLLENQHRPHVNSANLVEGSSSGEAPEIGLQLLENAFRNPAVPEVVVGTRAPDKVSYVRAVNNVDCAWPPPSGYSFACWLKFPAAPQLGEMPSEIPSYRSPRVPTVASAPLTTVSASLCEGWVTMNLHGKEAPVSDVYGVLVEKMLTLFPSKASAVHNYDHIEVVEVTAVERNGNLGCLLWSSARQFHVGFSDIVNFDMWWRALKQAQALSDEISASKPRDNWGFVSENDARGALASRACILSIYSLQSAGCPLHVYFDQGTGYLCLDTAAARTAPSGGSSSKRAPVVFEQVQVTKLWPVKNKSATHTCGDTRDEKGTHWHHLAFSHRKAVMGNSLVTVYVDGSEIATKKLHYPPSSSAGCFQVYVGTDKHIDSLRSQLTWNVGPTWLTEQIVTSGVVAGMFLRGPTYTGQFSDHVYRPDRGWSEALATSVLARIADTGINIATFAKRLQLPKLGRSSQKQWRRWGDSDSAGGKHTHGDAAMATVVAIVDSMAVKRDELADGLRLATGTMAGGATASRKEKSRVDAFRHFIRHGCSMDAFGNEAERQFSSFPLSQDMVLFSLNTACSEKPTGRFLANTNVQYVGTEASRKLDLVRALPWVGGIARIIFPLLDGAWRCTELKVVVKMLARALHRNPSCMAECLETNGYALITGFLCQKAHLIDESVLKGVVRLAVGGNLAPYAKAGMRKVVLHPVVTDAAALSNVVLSCQLRKKLPHHLQCQMLALLMDLLVPANPNALFNARQLRREGFMQWAMMFVSELGNEDCEVNVASALERRWCYPTFVQPTFEAILQYVLSLLRAFLHTETHVDDIQLVADTILLSLTCNPLHVVGSPVRLILLQFLLHEIEYSTLGDKGDGRSPQVPDVRDPATQGIISTIVDAILLQEGANLYRKPCKGDVRSPRTTVMNSTMAKVSDNDGQKLCPTSAASGLANVLVEVMNQEDDNGRFVAPEMLLAMRILLSLAQTQAKFAEHLFRTPLYPKFKRALQKRSNDCSVYIVLLAYVSNIPITNTDYYDGDTLTSTDLGPQPFPLPAPGSLVTSGNHLLDSIWDLIGSLLGQNCQLPHSEYATAINVMVLEKIAFQVENSQSFFVSVCKSSDAVLRFVEQCLFSYTATVNVTAGGMTPRGSVTGCCKPNDQEYHRLEQAMEAVSSSQSSMCTAAPVDAACLNMIQVVMGQALANSDNFASLMMRLLELLTRGASDSNLQSEETLADGQKCWLKLVSHLVESKHVFGEGCSNSSLTNISSLAVALARYLAHEDNHLKNSGHGVDSLASSCFGIAVLEFLLGLCQACADSQVASTVGVDEQRFFQGSLVYSAQTVVLNELKGLHRDATPPQRLLNCLLTSKDFLFQQPDYSSVMIYNAHSNQKRTDVGADTDVGRAATDPLRPSSRGNRTRTLSTSSHKTYGLGVDSDHNYIVSLAAELFRMLIDDTESARRTAIILWQFLLRQHQDVLKELLIVEPRVTVLQSITTAKKEVIDVFHGGFDRLQSLSMHSPYLQQSPALDGESDLTRDWTLNQEIWCQFQLWVMENFALLTELLVSRTESTHRHLMNVLGSCCYVQKVLTTSETTGAQGKRKTLTLNVNFSTWRDIRNANALIPDNLVLESIESDERKHIMRSTLLHFSCMQDDEQGMIHDALSQWRKVSVRLKQERSLWSTGVDIPPSDETGANAASGGPHCSTEASNIKRTRTSVFQCSSSRYCLDVNEDPKRMRLRLIRDYSVEAGVKKDRCGGNGSSDGTNSVHFTALSQGREDLSVSAVPEDPFRRIHAFQKAVETFRVLALKPQAALGSLGTLQDLVEASNASTEGAGRTPQAISCVMLARTLFRTYLGDCTTPNSASNVGVSLGTVTEIDYAIAKAEENGCVVITPTLFDGANAEAMQSLLCVAKCARFQSDESTGTMEKSDSPRGQLGESDDNESLPDEEPDKPTAAVERVKAGSDNDERDKKARFVGVGKSASDDEEEDTWPMRKTILSPDICITRDTDTPVQPDLLPKQAEKTPGREDIGAMQDASADEVYAIIARFLQRDDYPPLQCFNAVHVLGMAKTSGLLVLSPHALYFVPGYGKVCHPSKTDIVDGTTGATAGGDINGFGGLASPLTHLPHQYHDGSGIAMVDSPSSSKKKPKLLLRKALGDLTTPFLHPKVAHTEPFLVVPVGEHQGASPAVSSAVADCSSVIPFASGRWKIKYKNVKRLSCVKCQLRPVGIELFETSGATYFLQFESFSTREEAVKLLLEMPLQSSSFWTPTLRGSAQIVPMKQIRKAFTKRWLRGAMSNFEYLMCLNTLAGRSFNDLTQYPVFPWVLSDYTSTFLDLEVPESFRDLSKPMGAIGESRAEQFRERYAALTHDSDCNGNGPLDTPAFHYGTHYSCSAYVVNYLIRLQPFTALALELQGGGFDHPDRLFRSLASSWTSASSDNLQDVRELIPEFFYLPEFLHNSNDCTFGTTQSGEVVSHVVLPPWAHDDPREFVRLHRRALESKYVSEHLHEWIDLIFGVKQRGRAAVKAQNVFMSFTYEGTVDTDRIEDPVLRAATQAQIENFGQTPSRLFSSAHPPRKVPVLHPTPLAAAVAAGSTLPSASPTSPTSGAPNLGHLCEDNSVDSIETFIKWHAPLAPALVAIGKDYAFLKKHSATTLHLNGIAVGDVRLVYDKLQCEPAGCSLVPPRFAKCLDWGSGGGVITLHVRQPSSSASLFREDTKVLTVVEGVHKDRINCAVLTDDGELLVTGGQDAVVNVTTCSKAADGRRVFQEVAKLVGHESAVESVAISKDLQLIASGSADCSALLWDLRSHSLLRELAGHSAAVHHVSINAASANVLTATTSELRLWSINGDLLAASSSSAFGLFAITCAISTQCEPWQNGVVAVTGHADGVIALWRLQYPSDLARQRQEEAKAEALATNDLASPRSGNVCSSGNDTTRSSSWKPAATHTAAVCTGSGSVARKTVAPSCRLYILKLLLDHRASVTALTLSSNQRELLSGDAEGNCIRWVDDSAGANVL